jgi:MFS family permease
MDGSLYLVLTAVPLRAIGLKATPFILGLLPVLGSGIYVLAALFFGRLSDRVSRVRMARLGAWIRVFSALGLTQAHSVVALLAWMPVLGIASGLFWPGLQAAVGEAWPERDLGRNIGGFNISWSSGKMMGFLLGGVLMTGVGYGAVLLLAAGATALSALLLPSLPRSAPAAARAGVPGVPAGSPDPEDETWRTRRAWRWIGWLGNFVLFGVGATLNYQYPKLMVTLGFTGRDFGIYLGAVYLFQTLSFAVLRGWSGWHFRLAPLLWAQGLTCLAAGCLGWLHTRALILATAPWIGLGLGMSYSSSIYYSLYRESGRGKNTGIHEALLGTGTFLLPLVGGMLAQATRTLRAPYLLCAAVLAAAMIAELWLARGASGTGQKKKRPEFPPRRLGGYHPHRSGP